MCCLEIQVVRNETGDPSGGLDFTDGACVTAKQFDTAFPYLTTPIPGSPQSAFEAASTNAVPAKPGACQ